MSFSKALLLGCLACSVSLATPVLMINTRPAIAVGINKSLSVQQGYNFQATARQPFGYIKILSIGNVSVPPDTIVAQQPSDFTTTLPGISIQSSILNTSVVAVLSNVEWNTLPTGDITFKGRVSPLNALLLRSLLQSSNKSQIVAFSFVIYDYDLLNQTYYPSFKSASGTLPSGIQASSSNIIYGLLPINGISINSSPSSDVNGISNFEFNLRLLPTVASSPQKLQIQTSPTAKQIKPWGLLQN